MSAKAKKDGDRRGVRPGWNSWIRLRVDGRVYNALNVDLPTAPGCYELAIARSGEHPRSVYVGHATERDRGIETRVHHHASAVSGDKFCNKVLAVRRNGFHMFVSYKKTSRAGAKPLEDRCLEEWWRYHWNTVKMPWGRA